jgi:hypothetical protein
MDVLGRILMCMSISVFYGCGDNTSISSVSSKTATFDLFKAEIAERFDTAFGSVDIRFPKDFDLSVELLETLPIRAVDIGEYGSTSDILSLRKSFYDLIGEIQNHLDIVWSDRRAFVYRITPEWYRTVPVQVINLMTATALIRRASKSRSSRDYSLFLHQASVVLTLPMARPDSPFDVSFLIRRARDSCAALSMSETERKKLRSIPTDADQKWCTELAFRAIPSLWVLTVANAKIGLLPEPLIHRLNWAVVLVNHYSSLNIDDRKRFQLLNNFFSALRYNLMEDERTSPDDIEYPNKLIMYMFHLDRVIPVPEGCRNTPHILCVQVEKFTDTEFKLDPRGPIRDLYPN